jgi:hypothetical protein
MASKWENLETLIGKERILVFNPERDEVLNSAFSEKFNAEKAANERVGAAVRWAVQATTRGELKLILQRLSAGARSIRAEPLLTTDECSTIHLDAFETETDLKARAGPGPVRQGPQHHEGRSVPASGENPSRWVNQSTKCD